MDGKSYYPEAEMRKENWAAPSPEDIAKQARYAQQYQRSECLKMALQISGPGHDTLELARQFYSYIYEEPNGKA